METGASVYGPEAAFAAIESGWFDCLEIAYSLWLAAPKAVCCRWPARRMSVSSQGRFYC